MKINNRKLSIHGLLIISSLFLLAWGCNSSYPGVPRQYHTLLDSAMVRAGDNSAELMNALETVARPQKEGMAFLISYMPERDLVSLTADFLQENVEYAYLAREKYSWCAELPDSIFLNEVLPYANITETRDPWRKDFYERFSKYVDDKDNIIDALLAVAENIKDEVEVEYNTKRSKVDSSPREAMAENMATCTGLSILLTDAYRAVGIPSRLAGTAMWTNYRGNHTWSEVWVDDKWQFIEYYPDSLNKSWFLADAGKADPENPLHWIYAVSYKPTGQYYYAGVSTFHLIDQLDINLLPEQMRSRYERMKQFMKDRAEDPYVWGHNVTERYIDLYRAAKEKARLGEDETMGDFVVFMNEASQDSQSRVSCRIDIIQGEKTIDFGYSPRKTDDMNHFLKMRLKKGSSYTVKVSSPENNIEKDYNIETGNEHSHEFKLFLHK